MTDIFTSPDGPPVWLKEKAITVFGFGAQGEAQALNLKESGCRVTVCLYPSSQSIEKAKALGLTAMTDSALAARQTEIAVLLTPDAKIPELWNAALAEHLPTKATLIFAHGFAIHYHLITPKPTQDVILVAPMGHGSILRQKFLEGSAIPAVSAVHQDASGRAMDTVRAYAQAIGCARVGVITSTFKEETETDLFAEQTTTVGGLTDLIRASFETMVAAGYAPEIAYWSTLRELEGMMRIIAQRGIAEFVNNVSATARYGALTRGPRVINGAARSELKKILKEIQSGEFLQELQHEAQSGYTKSCASIAIMKDNAIECVHKKFK